MTVYVSVSENPEFALLHPGVKDFETVETNDHPFPGTYKLKLILQDNADPQLVVNTINSEQRLWNAHAWIEDEPRPFKVGDRIEFTSMSGLTKLGRIVGTERINKLTYWQVHLDEKSRLTTEKIQQDVASRYLRHSDVPLPDNAGQLTQRQKDSGRYSDLLCPSCDKTRRHFKTDTGWCCGMCKTNTPFEDWKQVEYGSINPDDPNTYQSDGTIQDEIDQTLDKVYPNSDPQRRVTAQDLMKRFAVGDRIECYVNVEYKIVKIEDGNLWYESGMGTHPIRAASLAVQIMRGLIAYYPKGEDHEYDPVLEAAIMQDVNAGLPGFEKVESSDKQEDDPYQVGAQFHIYQRPGGAKVTAVITDTPRTDGTAYYTFQDSTGAHYSFTVIQLDMMRQENCLRPVIESKPAVVSSYDPLTLKSGDMLMWEGSRSPVTLDPIPGTAQKVRVASNWNRGFIRLCWVERGGRTSEYEEGEVLDFFKRGTLRLRTSADELAELDKAISEVRQLLDATKSDLRLLLNKRAKLLNEQPGRIEVDSDPLRPTE